MKNKLVILAALVGLLLASTGCTVTKYSHPGGAKFERVAFGNKTGIGKVKFNPETGAFELEGYSSEQTELAAAITQAVIAAKGGN